MVHRLLLAQLPVLLFESYFSETDLNGVDGVAQNDLP